MLTLLFTLFYPLIRFLYQFKEVPLGFAMVAKNNKSDHEKVLARSFLRYFFYHVFIFFLFFVVAIGSVLFSPIDILSFKISVPMISAVVYFCLNHFGRDTLGREWFESRREVNEQRFERWKRRFHIPSRKAKANPDSR